MAYGRAGIRYSLRLSRDLHRAALGWEPATPRATESSVGTRSRLRRATRLSPPRSYAARKLCHCDTPCTRPRHSEAPAACASERMDFSLGVDALERSAHRYT